MYLSSFSPAAVRFLASIKDGRGLKPSCRLAGITMTVGYRFLEEVYLRERRAGKLAKDVLLDLGVRSSLVQVWELRVGISNDRHHLRVDVENETAFWKLFDRGASVEEARPAAGVSRSTVYRWIEKRFRQLRGHGLSCSRCARQLRLTAAQCKALEERRLTALRLAANAESVAQRHARSEAGRLADQVISNGRSLALRRRDERRHDYWELMRKGVSNVDACRLLGMSRVAGTRIRQEANFRIPIPSTARPMPPRYLELRERLQIADLLGLGS